MDISLSVIQQRGITVLVKRAWKSVFRFSTLMLLAASALLAYWGLDYVNHPELVTFGAEAEIGVLENNKWTATGVGYIGRANTIRFPRVIRHPKYNSAKWVLTRNLYGQCGNTQIEQLSAPERSSQGYEVYVRFEIPAVFQPGTCCYITTAEVYAQYNLLHRWLAPLKAQSPEVCFEAKEPSKESLRVDKLTVEEIEVVPGNGSTEQ